MSIGVIGSKAKLTAFLKLNTPNVTVVQDSEQAANFSIFIDLDWDFYPSRLLHYTNNNQTVFLLSATNCQIEQAMDQFNITYAEQQFLGINALPTFIERSTLEYCNPFNIQNLPWGKLPWLNHEEVQSRVGLVSPRIVLMIINEAYFTLQEETANKTDIDIAMQLGTAYPYGPFKWCNLIGLNNVYQTLLAMYKDTSDERYKICPLLKSELNKENILL